MRFVFSFLFLMGVFAGSALADAPPGNIYPVAPFTNAQHFTTVPCGKPFRCDSRMRDEDFLQAANLCAQNRLGFPDKMMTLFQKEGPYENCALPETYAPKGPRLGAAAQWPICCVEDKGNGLCSFSCHYYISGSVR